MARPFLTRVSLEHFALGAAMLVFAQAFLRFFATGSGDLKDGDWRIQIILAVFYGAVFAIGVLHLNSTIQAALRAPGLIALLGLAGASALWASLPTVALRRAGGVLGASLFGVVLASRLAFQEQLLLLRKVLRFATVCCLALWVLKLTTNMDFVTMGQSSNPMADGVDADALRGIFGHKNGLGAMMALAILVDWHLPVRGTLAKTIRIGWFCGYAALLYWANSATALVACVATLGILYTVKKFRNQYGLLFPLLSLGSLIGAAVLGLFRDEAMQVLGRSSDLTGRTDLWQWVIVMIMKRPWLGYGYSSFWRGGSDESDVIESHIGWSPIYAHNGYLELALSLGIIGLLIFLFVIGQGLWRAVIRAKNAQDLQDLWPLAFLVFFVLHNFGECTILLQNNLEWALCIAVIIRSHPAYAVASQSQLAESEPDHQPDQGEAAFSPEPEYI
jgi:exopolysaccharide production protein ExoQ